MGQSCEGSQEAAVVTMGRVRDSEAHFGEGPIELGERSWRG